MAEDQESRGPSPEDLGQDPFVERLRPDPSQPPERVRILEGLSGDSDREGYKRLYFTRELDYYAEFRAEDVVYSEPIRSEEPPLVGVQATRVGIRWDATIEYTRVRTPRPVDEFDLDVRLGALRGERGPGAMRLAHTVLTAACGTCLSCHYTCHNTCPYTGCGHTCGNTCQTCQTNCGTCAGATCRTACQECWTEGDNCYTHEPHVYTCRGDCE